MNRIFFFNKKQTLCLAMAIAAGVWLFNGALLFVLNLWVLILAIGWGLIINRLMQLNDRGNLRIMLRLSRKQKCLVHFGCLAALLLSFCAVDYYKCLTSLADCLIFPNDRVLVIKEVIIMYLGGIGLSYGITWVHRFPNSQEIRG